MKKTKRIRRIEWDYSTDPPTDTTIYEEIPYVFNEKYWFLEPTSCIFEYMLGYEASESTLEKIESMIEEHLLHAWDVVFEIDWANRNQNPSKFDADLDFVMKTNGHWITDYFLFLEASHNLINKDRIEAFDRWIQRPDDLENIVKSYTYDKLDNDKLDFLEGKITSEKMINWAVGQVMQKYPKKFSPKEAKEAIEARWKF